MASILFIHGFGGGSYEFQPIIRFLKKHGYKKFHEFCYKEKWGRVPISRLSQQLAKFINKNIKEELIDIISMSQGGIIARHYISNHTNKKIRRCITICTPHNGSLTAYIGRKEGFIDLRPESELLTRLNKEKEKTEFYSVYNPLDLMVFPGWNARFNKAKKNKKVFAIIHPWTFWRQPTLNFILESLNDKN